MNISTKDWALEPNKTSKYLFSWFLKNGYGVYVVYNVNDKTDFKIHVGTVEHDTYISFREVSELHNAKTFNGANRILLQISRRPYIHAID